jgi:hypothetical protein
LTLPILTAVAFTGLPHATAGVKAERWVRPSPERRSDPIWGHQDGLQVGLWPTPGPRGLFRIYAPYLDHPRLRMINYVSIEPVVNGRRGQSELERGAISSRPGLSFRAADSRNELVSASETGVPPRGRVERRGGTELLRLFVATEPFRNGARPVVQVLFRADRPHEVGFKVDAGPESAPMEACVLSATMGNYARLRRVWLKDDVADSRQVWPTYTPDRLNFAPWHEWSRERLLKVGKDRVVAATSDEADPASATYEAKVPPHWRYEGRPATQYWRTRDVEGLEARVNGRSTYWGEQGAIPGGVSYENFELQAPFSPGQEFWFGVTTESPRALGFRR